MLEHCSVGWLITLAFEQCLEKRIPIPYKRWQLLSLIRGNVGQRCGDHRGRQNVELSEIKFSLYYKSFKFYLDIRRSLPQHFRSTQLSSRVLSAILEARFYELFIGVSN